MNGLGTRLRSSHQLHLHRYDLYDIAYLAGGHIRVADTAVLALVESGRIRVLPDGRLVVVELRRRHPVEAAALDAIGGRGWRDVASVRWRFEADPRLTAIVERLRRDGLVRQRGLPIPPGRRRTPQRTRAGRRLLRRLRLRPPVDEVAAGTNAMLVALRGTTGMPDRRLREDIFGPSSPPRSRTESWRPRVGGSPDAPFPSARVGEYGAGFGIWFGVR
jgi:hypothetical protein